MSSDPVNPAVQAVSVFFPCYNDEATIARMVEVAVATLGRVGVADAEVIVVNDGSSDRSAAILDELMAKEPLLRVVTHEHNRGYGGALLSGGDDSGYADQSGYDYGVSSDSATGSGDTQYYDGGSITTTDDGELIYSDTNGNSFSSGG